MSDVELGMFIQKMEGSWFKHPFWKARFLLDDQASLSHLKASELEAVIINTAKGKDLAPPVAEPAPVVAKPRVAPRRPARQAVAYRPTDRISVLKNRQSIDLQSTKPTSTENELGAANRVADTAQKKVSSLFDAARLGQMIDARAVEPVVADIYASVLRNSHAFSGLMRCKLNNELVYRHALAVSALMISLARTMKLTEDETREAGLAGLFLDMGTNYLSRNPAPLNGDYRNAEPAVWQKHVELGHKVLEDTDGIPEAVKLACLQHHERIDGTGFPHGIAAMEISQLGRMAAICDTFDYLLTDCEAAAAIDPAQAIANLRQMEGAFDADILRSFIESVGVYPVGSFVRLRSDRLALVIDEDPEDVTKPVVSTFYSFASGRRVRTQKIELARCYGSDEIVGIADLSGQGLPEEAQLRELEFMKAHKIKR